MGRYKLGINKKKDEVRIVDLDKIVNLKDLQTLDEFTTSFGSETELKIYLFNQGLINNKELEQKLDVLYRYNYKVKKTAIFFEDMKKYLDIEYLKHQLDSLSQDMNFLEKLANYYSNGSTRFNDQGVNVQEIRGYLAEVRRNGGDVFQSSILRVALDDLFKKAITKSVNRMTGEVELDYKGLRDLALFIYKYNKSLKKKEEIKKEPKREEWEQILISELDDTGKWTLSSEGEPDFPPNSEEEKSYQTYLDSLPTPISSDIEERSKHR